MTNTLAYYASELSAVVKSFMAKPLFSLNQHFILLIDFGSSALLFAAHPNSNNAIIAAPSGAPKDAGQPVS